MPKAAIEIRGKSSRWEVVWDAPQSQIDAMTEDGIEISTIENAFPEWVANLGLGPMRIWCFFQDVFNFKNPFKQ